VQFTPGFLFFGVWRKSRDKCEEHCGDAVKSGIANLRE